MIAATPVGVRSAPSRMGSSCEPSGQSGTMQRKPGTRSGTTLRHSLPSARRPWTKTSGGPLPSSR